MCNGISGDFYNDLKVQVDILGILFKMFKCPLRRNVQIKVHELLGPQITIIVCLRVMSISRALAVICIFKLYDSFCFLFAKEVLLCSSRRMHLRNSDSVACLIFTPTL